MLSSAKSVYKKILMNIFAKYLIFRQKHKVTHNITDKTLWSITLAIPIFFQIFITLIFLKKQKTCVMFLKFNSSHAKYLTFRILYGIVTNDEFF